MEKLTIEYLKKNNMIAYEYVRGSHAYGTNIKDENGNDISDTDIGGVFICPEEILKGLRSGYVEQVADEKNDTVYYELGRWVELLMKSNPTALESLFIPEDCIIGEIHPAVQYILEHRDLFVTKECLNPLLGYSFNQIKKAKGLNKKINIPEDFQRKDILDFCYTFKNQGSQPIKDFLEENGLNQKYCGLVNIPNMRDVYGVYYDFAAYFKFENIRYGVSSYVVNGDTYYFSKFNIDFNEINERIENKKFFHYDGIVNPDEIYKSNTVRLCSIPKGEKPICFMHYNKDAYTSHCNDYKEWVEWKKHRNPVRYENNKGHNYDSKNMSHTIRLMEMGVELAEGKGFNVRRTGDDVKHLLDIRNHVMSYEEIMQEANELKEKFDKAVEVTTLPEKIDYDTINNILLKARDIAYSKQFNSSDLKTMK